MRGMMLAAIVLLAAPIAGCADDGTGDTDEPVQVEWVQQPSDRDTGEAIDVSWRLTGPDGEVQHTGLHWAESSVSDPSTPADYGNASGVEEPATVPGEYTTSLTFDEEGTYYVRAHMIEDGEHRWTSEVAVEVTDSGRAEAPVVVTVDEHTEQAAAGDELSVNWSLEGAPDEVDHTGFHWAEEPVEDPTSPADYGNSSGVQEPADVPGSYNASFTEDEPGTYHGRAHAIYEGQHHWSDEVTFEVTADNGGATQHTIDMEGFAYDPAELTVSPGDTINWTNLDATTHTVTFQDEENGTDSGDVAAGEHFNWTVPEDTPAGTYAYRCTYHSQGYETGMVAEITVEAS